MAQKKPRLAIAVVKVSRQSNGLYKWRGETPDNWYEYSDYSSRYNATRGARRACKAGVQIVQVLG